MIIKLVKLFKEKVNKMAYESENELKKLQMRDSGGIDGTSTVQSDYANGSAAPITPTRTGGYGENATGMAQRTGGYGENASSKVQAPKKSVVKQAPKKSTPAAKSVDAARASVAKVETERKRKTARADAARMRMTFMAQKSSNSNNAPGGGKGQENRARGAEIDIRAQKSNRTH